MRQRDRGYLLDILEAAKLATGYLFETTLENFMTDILKQDAVTRRLEIIGEAARRVSEETRQAHSDLPWGDMVGMRNLLIHEYDDVDFEVVWDTVKTHLPRIISYLEKI